VGHGGDFWEKRGIFTTEDTESTEKKT